MKYFVWDNKKNEWLRKERGISFEEAAFYIEQEENVLDIIEHPNQERYEGQQIFIVDIEGYAYLIPFLEEEETVFLKTVIPSRQATKKYLRKDKHNG